MSKVAKRGPKTAEGRLAVRLNASTHGILSPRPVVSHFESEEGWETHRKAILESLSPEGGMEQALAERVALSSWRLNRVVAYETEALALLQEKVEDDLHTRSRMLRSLGDNPYASTHPDDIRAEAQFSRSSHNALKRFSSGSLKPHKILRSEDASSVMHGVLVAAQKASGAEIDEDSLESLSGGFDIYEPPPMSVAAVRACVEEIASRVSRDPDELLEAATEEARWEVARAATRKEEMEGDLSRMRRERMLPPDDTLQKVARYEAHLWRQLSQALHELEALQERRAGGKAPLVRLDAQGID